MQRFSRIALVLLTFVNFSVLHSQGLLGTVTDATGALSRLLKPLGVKVTRMNSPTK